MFIVNIAAFLFANNLHNKSLVRITYIKHLRYEQITKNYQFRLNFTIKSRWNRRFIKGIVTIQEAFLLFFKNQKIS